MAARRTTPKTTASDGKAVPQGAGPEQAAADDSQESTSVDASEESSELSPTQQAYADALLREREGYTRRGLDGRVAEVDAELNRIGAGRTTRRRERAVPPPRERA